MPHRDTPAATHGPPDAELAAILPAITGPGGPFRHRQHINLAFLAVQRYGMPEATTKICSWIRHIAAYERAPQKYHHTVSRAWVEIVAHHVETDPDCAGFDAFAVHHPALLDKRLLSRSSPTCSRSRGPLRTARTADRSPTAWAAFLAASLQSVRFDARPGRPAALVEQPGDELLARLSLDGVDSGHGGACRGQRRYVVTPAASQPADH
jgi:hypothetical protein